MIDQPRLVRITADLDPELHRRLRHFVHEQDMLTTQTDVVRALVHLAVTEDSVATKVALQLHRQHTGR